ncbi:MAG: NADP-dependent malic enzyme [Alphaproteobacteria bacterium]|nr:NADP-dependent malic enzyme [Alphaproteobacteria bacterium]
MSSDRRPKRPTFTEQEALLFHQRGKPGKLEINPTKPMATQRDLSLAYSPGVAVPVRKIAEQPDTAYDYTAKGNLVAVISNGTAILGLGDLGALASKPVMEGKAVLFKRFADVDSIDLEVDTHDVDEFVGAVRYLGPSFGGINLEDIKAPDCFIIEQRLRELMDIPVFHDDQHGTAIIATAGLINALEITNRNFKSVKLVCNGAGAAAIACVELIKSMGMKHENVILCDTKGVIYQGRTESMNQWKSAHAAPTKARTLKEAMEGADVFFGLSVKGAVDKAMVRSMAAQPIIFAMANPDPEITPEEAKEARADVIIATGRSDYPNQVNNVLGFPFIFRGALDVRARTINEDMKIAAAHAIAALAREDVPDGLDAAYAGRKLQYGPEYIIPVPFDPRLISVVPAAVAKAAMDSGVARKPIADMEAYRHALQLRRDPAGAMLDRIFETVKANPKRVVFAEGEEEKTIRAAIAFRNSGYGTPVLIGREERVAEAMRNAHINQSAAQLGLEVHNARLSKDNKRYADYLYARLRRHGSLHRDCQRLVNQDRNVFAALMVATGDADAMVTGTTRSYYQALEDITRVIDAEKGKRFIGLTVMMTKERTVFVADTTVTELPNARDMAEIAIAAAAAARKLGHEPRVALTSFSNFGNPVREKASQVREAVQELERMHDGGREIDFEFDGDMSPEVALDYDLMKNLYPFARLTGPANVLVMPGLHSANISSKLVQMLAGGTVVGPILVGLSAPAQIAQVGASVGDIVNMAALGAFQAIAKQG